MLAPKDSPTAVGAGSRRPQRLEGGVLPAAASPHPPRRTTTPASPGRLTPKKEPPSLAAPPRSSEAASPPRLAPAGVRRGGEVGPFPPRPSTSWRPAGGGR